MINSSRPSASVFPPPHLIITRNAHGAEEGEGLGTRLRIHAARATGTQEIESERYRDHTAAHWSYAHWNFTARAGNAAERKCRNTKLA